MIKSTLLFAAVGFAAALCSLTLRGVSAQEKPEPGKQVLQKIELPKSTSDWNWKEEGVTTLGRIRPLDEPQKEAVSYWLFLPTDESAKTDAGFPLLLFLHGAGERGDNPDTVKTHGPPKLVETEKGKTWPFITVSPQCPDKMHWSPQQLLLLLDDIEARYPVDKSRIYVTGLSMGGFGTYMLIDLAGDRFAAAMPLCGGYDPAKAEKMTKTPIWAFHGDADGAVPIELDRAILKAIEDAGGQVKFTVYPGVGHDCWTQTYNDPAVYQWLLDHRLAK